MGSRYGKRSGCPCNDRRVERWPALPIETALTPQALRVNKIDIGFDLRRGSTLRDVPEEALMLTGDENIVGVDFSVLWKVKPNHVGDFLFNVQGPEATVKAVGESAMRARGTVYG
jgi:modulator of FtsH protease HflK